MSAPGATAWTCARRLPQAGGFSLATAAIILAGLSLVFGPIGFVAILVAVIDLLQIARGRQSGREKQRLDVIAIALSLLGLLLSVVFIAYVWSRLPSM